MVGHHSMRGEHVSPLTCFRLESNVKVASMKLGIPILVVGVVLLILSIPYSIVSLVSGIGQLEEGIVSGGVASYLGIIGVVAGFILTAIGAIRVFKQ
jgi:hypothetical protein